MTTTTNPNKEETRSEPEHLFTLKTVQNLVSNTSIQVNRFTKQNKSAGTKGSVHAPLSKDKQNSSIYIINTPYKTGAFNTQVRQTQAKKYLHIVSVREASGSVH